MTLDTERHRLHVAVADLLSVASREAPLLLVLEDIHWADVPTLLLLRHLTRTAGEARILVVATYRDVGETAASDLTETLTEVRRSDATTLVHLAALGVEEVAEFVRRNTGVEPADELASAIVDLSGGNAFLVTELWRELVDTESLSDEGGVLALARPSGRWQRRNRCARSSVTVSSGSRHSPRSCSRRRPWRGQSSSSRRSEAPPSWPSQTCSTLSMKQSPMG